ncbi:MAG: ECF transporter S component [Lachnospiraceae bacterium]|nr:ECF transporter S component [Lachnospiraceae bacterium]
MLSENTETELYEDKHLKKEKIISLAIIFIFVPLTALSDIYVFKNTMYNILSTVIMLEILFALIISAEGRRLKTGELIIVAVMSAIGVCGRMAFYMLPQVKPLAAIIIISGISLGAYHGFLVGALSVFVSNIFFGQGIWTPWQMFGFGIIGFVSGIVFNKKKPGRLSLSAFGFASVLIIYGGIMNPASVLMFQPSPKLGMIITSYIMGFPFDMVHAVSTALFLLIIGRPMFEMIARIKQKYNI